MPQTADSTRYQQQRHEAIRAAAAVFSEKGYHGASTREIAARIGIKQGSLYYYFKSKEHLVQAFYARSHAEHLAAFEPHLATESSFEELLRQLLLAKIETAEPYHRFSGLLFQTAADPKSPLNPFSAESEETRADATALFERLLEASDQKIPADLREELPSLLWLFEMSVILFWIHDESEGRQRTRALIDRTVHIVATLLNLSRLPLMGGLRRTVPDLLKDLRNLS